MSEVAERRLAAIVAIDVAGYSRLMGADEQGTLAALKGHREATLPIGETHGGRVVGTAGDGELWEFPSITEAVLCAVEVQALVAERNAEVSDDRKMLYRIGINLGDVMVDGEDIYGNGINVAARLETLAPPGGICVSAMVRDGVRDRVNIDFEDLGEVEVKNIARPVRVFRVVSEGVATETPAKQAAAKSIYAVAASIAIILLAAGVSIWWWEKQPDFELADPAQMTFKLPEKPSIAVLPFDNLSRDPTQEFFADGLTGDIITDLSKISGLFVIARNSSFAYKQKKTPISKVAEELGVRYVLEGSVRRANDEVRVNVQLIDTISGGHIWAERFDGSTKDVFALQDRVTQKIVTALSVSLTIGEQARNETPETKNPNAYDAFLRGWSYYQQKTAQDFAKAVPLLRQAIELDPTYARAHAALAAIFNELTERLSMTGSGYWSVVLGVTPEDASELVNKHLSQALKDPVPLARKVASRSKTNNGRHDNAIEEARKAIALDGNDPNGYEALARALVFAGRPMEADVAARKALRLDPQNAQSYLFWLGFAQFGQEKFNDAKVQLIEAVEQQPEDDRALILLAATYGYLDEIGMAKDVLQGINRLRKKRNQLLAALPESGVRLGFDVYLVGDYALDDVNYWPFKEKSDRERLREGLDLAGVPETDTGAQVSPIVVAGAVTIDAETAKKLYDEGVRFVDVRGKADYQGGFIPGAIHLDLDTMFTKQRLAVAIRPDEPVVIYCMGPRCLRSSNACSKAVRWEYEKIYYFRTGFPAWKAAGYSVELPKPSR